MSVKLSGDLQRIKRCYDLSEIRFSHPFLHPAILADKRENIYRRLEYMDI